MTDTNAAPSERANVVSTDAANAATPLSVDKSTLNLPAVLVVMDGFGLAPDGPGNAISVADTPVFDRLMATCSHTTLSASGNPVGLPEGQMGNSEVGHLNIGAGRVVFQELTRIDNACADGTLQGNEALCDAMDKVASNDSTLHLMGLLSDGGVHSSNQHLYALLRMAAEKGVRRVRVHCFLDGRDVPPASAIGYVEELEGRLSDLPADVDASIASLSGRYYAMDRDNRWERVERAWQTLWNANNHTDLSPVEALEASYAQGVTDEFVVPVAFDGAGMRPQDAVVFFNFRPDRAREITRALCDSEFDSFARDGWAPPAFVCLTEYDPTIPAAVAFPKEFPKDVLADVLADAGLTQYHIAETEKYAHVTFFMNGGVEEPKAGEQRVLIASPKVATYDLQPEMSEPAVAQTLHDAIMEDAADVYIVNFANCDMVGHTGVVTAAVSAVEAVDAGVGLVLDAVKAKGGVALVTADHGNADCMVAPDGTPFTAHTTNLVPFVCVDESGHGFKLKPQTGSLANIAPTLLAMVGLPKPAAMTGESWLA